jgi:hypothetical protein
MERASARQAALVLVVVGLVAAAHGLHRQFGARAMPGTDVAPTIVPTDVEGRQASTPHLPAVAGTSDGWWSAVQADLGRREYEASTTPNGLLQAPNRAHNLRTTFGEHGIAVVPRTDKDVLPAWQFAWEASGFGRAGRMESVGPATPEASGARVTYRRDGFCEWYENTVKGLEQGFTIERKPKGEGPLRITGDFPAALRPEVREDGAIDFIDPHGVQVLRYGELHVWDARGAELEAELLVVGTTLSIAIDDHDATYPLLVDPVITSPAWSAESDQANANFGFSVGTAGDVNGDGFSDVIVGARNFDNGETNEGRAYLYHGSASGVSFVPNWIAEGDQASAQFGYAVGTAGDVNGDAFSDVIVSAYLFDNDQTDEGRVFVYYGSPSGLSSTPSWTAESNEAASSFGWSAATAGDVNADGFSDVIVGANLKDGATEPDEGRVYIYRGSATGLGTPQIRGLGMPRAFIHFGFSVGTAGDVNADGFDDIIVGAIGMDNGHTDEGLAVVFHGSATGIDFAFDWSAESNQASALFGWSVGTAGDVNGDGYSDVVVGAINYDNGQDNEGRAFVYHGSATGLSLTANWTAESNQANTSFGGAVGTAGDLDGDGYGDVAVGASGFDLGETNEGSVFIYEGTATGLPLNFTTILQSNQAGAQLGNAVATAGDVNGDGFSDLLAGCYAYANGQFQEGAAFVYLGSAGSLATTATWTTEGGQNDALYGVVSAAGDVNGDGYSDVIVGAYLFDNGSNDEGRAYVYHGSPAGMSTTPAWIAEINQNGAQFGYPVSGAGDVNGDGYADVIVGAPMFNNVEFDEGRAYVYHGSPAGLLTSPAWITESNQDEAHFGYSVSSAGDVNGDGYDEVLVGAINYDNGEVEEGRSFLYLGSPAGLSTTAAWTAESNQTGALFGEVAAAGDVNGDGFGDVLVGALQYDNGQNNEGRSFLYLGSPVGLATIAAWTAESNQNDAAFGYSVSTAGDVNGDGFSDVVIGSPNFDNGQADEGQAYVYVGSASGLSPVAHWTAEVNQGLAGFGISVSTAGDVNGDGYSDVIVGAHLYDNFQTDGGRAAVYHGSAAGLSANPSWTFDAAQASTLFGLWVSTAGDVNGDGFSDVVVGANRYDVNFTNEGRAFFYYGNQGDGLERLPRQRRSDDSVPISPVLNSDSPSGFRLKAIGRTAAGRGDVQMQFEVKPFGVPFDETGVVTGAVLDTGVPSASGSAVPFTALASGLTPATLYHWRIRTISASPFFPRSPWITPAGNNVTEPDLRTAGAPLAVGEQEAPAAQLPLLEPVRPNPLRAQGEIAYTLREAGEVRLTVVDVAGRVRAVVAGGAQGAGRHTTRWDGRDANGRALPAGVYLLRLEAANHVTTRKLVIQH